VITLLNAICIAVTYSHHYAYSVHTKAAASMPQRSGVSSDEQQSERHFEIWSTLSVTSYTVMIK